MTYRLPVILIIASCLAGCAPKRIPAETDPMALPVGETFEDYWHNHGAEISRYRLQQARYGNIHEGDAVLIYVTEMFDPTAQVKYEGRDPEKDGAKPILKLNTTRKFITGVYPYSMMSSIFAPLNEAEPLKITTSSQEWCGHTYTQFNRRDGDWQLRLFSYFQAEGDQLRTLPAVATEAGIWTRIRLAPEELPTGEFKMIPDPLYQRLSHTEIKSYLARGTLTDIQEKGPHGEVLQAYTLVFAELNRSITIRFQKEFPHVIEGWEEQYDSFGKMLTTKATRTHSRMLPYWSQHDPKDRDLRESLGLSTDD